jgi:hypothetical protein
MKKMLKVHNVSQKNTNSKRRYITHSKIFSLVTLFSLFFELTSQNSIFYFNIDLGVYIVGSSANGFGTNQSDVDICLMISHEEVIMISS